MDRRTPYPKSARMRRQAQFRAVSSRGAVFPGREALVRRVANELGTPRLGIASPRRYGNAVERNRFRRLVREAFRAVAAELGAFDYLVSPRKHLETPTLEGLKADLLRTRNARPVPPRARRR